MWTHGKVRTRLTTAAATPLLLIVMDRDTQWYLVSCHGERLLLFARREQNVAVAYCCIKACCTYARVTKAALAVGLQVRPTSTACMLDAVNHLPVVSAFIMAVARH